MPIFSAASFNRAQDAPPYQQLSTHMQAAILSGQLKGGLKLPSTRALAAELRVLRITFLNAY